MRLWFTVCCTALLSAQPVNRTLSDSAKLRIVREQLRQSQIYIAFIEQQQRTLTIISKEEVIAGCKIDLQILDCIQKPTEIETPKK